VRWVLQNIASHGGDPTRIFLAGHSAGAVHVAEFIAHPQFHPGPAGPGVKGAIVISVAVDSTKFPMGDGNKAYYGADPEKWPEQHALPGLLKASPPLLVAYAELDPPAFEEQSKLLNEALCRLNRCPRLVMVPQHSHQSQTFSINTVESALTEAMLEFVKNTK
jgi:acetyl esterase/lipase